MDENNDYVEYQCITCQEGCEVTLNNSLNKMHKTNIIKKILKFDFMNKKILFELIDGTFGCMNLPKNNINANDCIQEVCNELIFYKKEGSINYYKHNITNAIYTYDKNNLTWNRIGIEK